MKLRRESSRRHQTADPSRHRSSPAAARRQLATPSPTTAAGDVLRLQRTAGNRAVARLAAGHSRFHGAARTAPTHRVQRAAGIRNPFSGKVAKLTQKRALSWLADEDLELYPEEKQHLPAFLKQSTKVYTFLEAAQLEADIERWVVTQTGNVRGEVPSPEPNAHPQAIYRIDEELGDGQQQVTFADNLDLPENGLFNDDGYWYEEVAGSGVGKTYVRTPMTGAAAFFRGLHFRKTWSPQKHIDEISKLVTHLATYSAASYEIAKKVTKKEIVDTPELEEATDTVLDELEQMKGFLDMHKPDNQKRYPYKPRGQDEHLQFKYKTRFYLNQFAAALSLYVNNQKQFEAEIAKAEKGYFGKTSFLKIPFISTSKSAKEAAEYAKGKLQKDEDLATTGVVGRMYVYVAPIEQMQKVGAVDVVSAHKGKKIHVCEWRFKEKEITFSGKVPADFLRGQMNLKAKDSVEDVADRADTIAAKKAKPMGGLVEYTSN